jgi:type III pantothenate kinase
MTDLILAVDVGNSRSKFGLFRRPDDAPRLPECLHMAEVPHGDEIPWGTIRNWTPQRPVAGAIAGAHPEGVERVRSSWPAEFGSSPQTIDDVSRFPLTISLPEPGKVGIDRLLNAVAVNRLREEGRPAIVVDCGTATTVDFVDQSGAFAGGAILPGFELSARALHRYTALLPLISIDELAAVPKSPLGTNTLEALHSGLFWGQLGAVRELVARLTPETSEPLLVLTGGGSHLLAPHFPQARHEPALALQGVVLAAASSGNE